MLNPKQLAASTSQRRRVQRDARTQQGYEANPPRCANCSNYVPPAHGVRLEDRRLIPHSQARCGIGHFSVNPRGICDAWVGKDGEGLEA